MAGMFCAFCMCLAIAQQPVGNVTGAYFSPGSDHIACVWRAGDGQSVVSVHDTSTGEQVSLVPLRSGLEWVGWCDDESFACQDAMPGVAVPRHAVRMDLAGAVVSELVLPLVEVSAPEASSSMVGMTQDLQAYYYTSSRTHSLEAGDARLMPVLGGGGDMVVCETIARQTQEELNHIALRSLPPEEVGRRYEDAHREASAAARAATAGWAVFGGPGDAADILGPLLLQNRATSWGAIYDQTFSDALAEAFAADLLWTRTEQKPPDVSVRTELHRWSWSTGIDESVLLSRIGGGAAAALYVSPAGGHYSANFLGSPRSTGDADEAVPPRFLVWSAQAGMAPEVLLERDDAHVVGWLTESELLVREGGWDGSGDALARVTDLRRGRHETAIPSAALHAMGIERSLANTAVVVYTDAAGGLCALPLGAGTPLVVASKGDWADVLDVSACGRFVAYVGPDLAVRVWAVGGDLNEVPLRVTLPEGPGDEPGVDGPAGANLGEAGPRLALLCESGAGVFYCEWQPTAGTAPSPPSASPVTVGEPVVYWQTLPDGAGAIAVLGAPTASDELGGIGTRVLACRSGGSSNVMQVSAPGVLDGACSVVCPSRDGKRAVVVVKQGRRSDIGILPLDLDAMAFGAGAQHGMLELDLLTYIDDGIVMDGAWSPGSDGIALLVVAAGDDGRPRVSLGAVRVDGAWGDGIVVAPELGLILLPRNNRAWSPSGEHLVFGGRERDAQGQDGLAPPESTRAYIWDTGTQATKPLTPEGWWAWPCAWSPDGREVLCARREAGARSAAGHAAEETELWAVATESGEARRIATVPHAVVGAEWSPDGMYIAALQYAEAGHAHLTLVAPDGALSDVPLPDGMAVVDAAWCR